MPRVESIRPGEVLEADLAEYPLPEILLGILRGNLGGALELELHVEPRDWIHFQDGVPVAVSLPDVPGSLSGLLSARGALDRETAARVEAEARRTGKSESQIITHERLLAEGALREGIRARARFQVVQLFDLVSCRMRFHEGRRLPAGAELAVLQLLPVLFEGLSRSKNRGPVERFLARYGDHRFRLAETYPRGVDPFEWGEQVERRIALLESPESIEDLVQAGLPRLTAQAALTALHLTDMVEVLDPVQRSGGPRPDFGAGERGGERPTFMHDQLRTLIAQKIEPLRRGSYYEILRVATSCDDDELIRAHRGLIARINTTDPAGRAHRSLVDEAFSVLTDQRLGPEYLRSLNDPERRAKLEAEPKFKRAVLLLASGEVGEADYWLEVAHKLDPGRRDLRPVQSLLGLASVRDRADAKAIAAELLPRLEAEVEELDTKDLGRGALAVVRAALADRRGALKVLESMGARGEAWRPWVERLLA